VQRGGTTGRTTTSRIKTLLLHIQAQYGRAEADGFLAQTKVDRDYLDDETRPLPIELWHSALVTFASRWGRDEIAKTVTSVVHAENLGVWTRVLRGTDDPVTAFAQLDQYGGDEALTELWQTVTLEANCWRGRLGVRGDANYENDGLCVLARCSELAALPQLFGLPPARVRSSVPKEGAAVEYEVRWDAVSNVPTLVGAVTGLAVGCAAGLVGAIDLREGAVLAVGAGAVGVLAGALSVHEQRRRAQSRAQMIRIQALERAATLRDARERGAQSFQEGAVIAGQYRLGPKLGVGASGAIWEAVRLADGEVVAIKLLRAAVHDTVAADRLRREAAALGLAWHPNVVEVFDDGHLPDGTSYLVMERLFGESLEARLREHGPLSPEETLPIALQVCDALGAVHAAGVVHRDLKPSNIFLSKSDRDSSELAGPPSLSHLPSGERVKLLDFGVARVEWAEPRLTMMGAPLGTPGYMSPEQEQGLEIDGRSDLFALGSVLYECLSGETPPLRQSALWSTAPAEAESGVQRAPTSIPAPWQRLIERAMAPLARDRFPDARAMRDALTALATQTPASSGTG
jgi:serine/threonine-protein kinase